MIRLFREFKMRLPRKWSRGVVIAVGAVILLVEVIACRTVNRAVVQLPPTERMIFLMHDVENYDHARIAHILGLSEDESRYGLHQGRLLYEAIESGATWRAPSGSWRGWPKPAWT